MSVINLEEILAKEARARIRSQLKRREDNEMDYKLKVSVDLGVTYTQLNVPKNIEKIKQIALELEQQKNVRWVIVDEKDEPKYWCQYIEANLRIDPSSTIATDDPYMTKLAKKFGFKVLSTVELLRSVGIENPEEKLAQVNMSKIDTADVLHKLQELIDQDVIKMTLSNIDEHKIGKELFGEITT